MLSSLSIVLAIIGAIGAVATAASLLFYAQDVPDIRGSYECLGDCQIQNGETQVHQNGMNLQLKNEVGEWSDGKILATMRLLLTLGDFEVNFRLVETL